MTGPDPNIPGAAKALGVSEDDVELLVDAGVLAPSDEQVGIIKVLVLKTREFERIGFARTIRFEVLGLAITIGNPSPGPGKIEVAVTPIQGQSIGVRIDEIAASGSQFRASFTKLTGEERGAEFLDDIEAAQEADHG